MLSWVKVNDIRVSWLGYFRLWLCWVGLGYINSLISSCRSCGILSISRVDAV